MASKDKKTLEQLQNLGNRLKQLRKEKGYTNYEIFAFDNNIPRAQYGRYEKGEDLKFSSLLKVLKALDISLIDFFREGFD
ncbi:MAG: helix-turn-helix domain-containing protein [Flavobacteriaceae bacterium]|nr:helix-turn-helix domain-containing protein [Flavobacteriaceae bacterium]